MCVFFRVPFTLVVLGPSQSVFTSFHLSLYIYLSISLYLFQSLDACPHLSEPLSLSLYLSVFSPLSYGVFLLCLSLHRYLYLYIYIHTALDRIVANMFATFVHFPQF